MPRRNEPARRRKSRLIVIADDPRPMTTDEMAVSLVVRHLASPLILDPRRLHSKGPN